MCDLERRTAMIDADQANRCSAYYEGLKDDANRRYKEKLVMLGDSEDP